MFTMIDTCTPMDLDKVYANLHPYFILFFQVLCDIFVVFFTAYRDNDTSNII